MKNDGDGYCGGGGHKVLAGHPDENLCDPREVDGEHGLQGGDSTGYECD